MRNKGNFMRHRCIDPKANGRLPALLFGLLILLFPAPGHTEGVKIYPVIEGDRLQIIFDWSGEIAFTATVDDAPVPLTKEGRQKIKATEETKGRELLLQFNRFLGSFDLDPLTRQASPWLESIRAGYDTLLLQSSAPVAYKIFSEGKKIRVEIVGRNSPQTPETSQDTDLLVTFAESVLAKNRPELMRPILKKYGTDFLSPHPLLAAQLMLALNDATAALSWAQKAANQPWLTLDQQITLVGLYGKLGQSKMINSRMNIQKLRTRIARELQAPKTSESRREELVFALLELKAYKQALPHLKQLALDFKGDWVFSYEETLTTLGEKQVLVDFWRLRARQPGLTDEEKRELAFQFLDAYSKADAERLFFALAQTAAPQSPDVEQLLFIWGPRPKPDQRKWLLDKARASAGDERAEWLKHLVNAGGGKEAIAFLDRELPAQMTDNLFAAYLSALEELDGEDAVNSSLAQRLKTEKNPDRLFRYGTLAGNQNQLKTAEIAFTNLLEIRPDDKRALSQLGLMYFDQSRWRKAEVYLGRLVNKTGTDWLTNYYYAEAVFLLGETSKARTYFQRALELIGKTASPTASIKMAQAHCLHRLGRSAEARVVYEDLLKVYSDDKKVRVKYISFLMDMGDFEQADKWLTLTAK
jgi:Flp pilus assembly protein TadD